MRKYQKKLKLCSCWRHERLMPISNYQPFKSLGYLWIIFGYSSIPDHQMLLPLMILMFRPPCCFRLHCWRTRETKHLSAPSFAGCLSAPRQIRLCLCQPPSQMGSFLSQKDGKETIFLWNFKGGKRDQQLPRGSLFLGNLLVWKIFGCVCVRKCKRWCVATNHKKQKRSPLPLFSHTWTYASLPQ